VTRTVLTAEQVNAIAEKLKEPYATLVLFLAAIGLRIGEALATKWTDFINNVLYVTRRIYDGDVDAVKSKRSERKLPIDPLLMERMEKLGKGEWVFRSRAGTPLNPGNALKRHVRPAAEKLRISLGGWHDFRHTLSTKLLRSGVHPKVVSDILGHKKVNLAMDVYDRTDVEDFVKPLALVFNELLPS
jgi:integrase